MLTAWLAVISLVLVFGLEPRGGTERDHNGTPRSGGTGDDAQEVSGPGTGDDEARSGADNGSGESSGAESNEYGPPSASGDDDGAEEEASASEIAGDYAPIDLDTSSATAALERALEAAAAASAQDATDRYLELAGDIAAREAGASTDPVGQPLAAGIPIEPGREGNEGEMEYDNPHMISSDFLTDRVGMTSEQRVAEI